MTKLLSKTVSSKPLGPKRASQVRAREYYYDLGRHLGGGASAGVYEVVGVEGREALDGRNVAKFLDRNSEFGDPGVQIARMRQSQDNLMATRGGARPIEFLEMVEFNAEASRPHIIQKMLPEGAVTIDPKDLMKAIYTVIDRGVGQPKAYDEVSKIFTVPMQRALAKLYYDLGQNGLFGGDLSLKNLYFLPAGDSAYVCGILDVDHIAHMSRVDEAPLNLAFKRVHDLVEDPMGNLNMRAYFSMLSDARRVADPAAKFYNAPIIMEKMLEFGGHGGNLNAAFIEFNEATGQFERNLIDPALIREFYPEFGNFPRREVPLSAPTYEDGSIPSVVKFADFKRRRAPVPLLDFTPPMRKAA